MSEIVRAIVGIDMGGTRIKAILRNSKDGFEIARKLLDTGDGEECHGVPIWAVLIRDLICVWELEHAVAVERVGIASPGLASRDGSHIVHMPGRMHGLEGFRFSPFLQRPCIAVNDAHAALLGEFRDGAARGYRDVLMLTLGTGVGGAMMMDGKLLKGYLGRAGHCGHICLDPNGSPGITGLPSTLEDAIGNNNIKQRSGGRFSSTLDLTDAVKAGDLAASLCWEKSVRALACGISSLINVVDPEIVVLGGGIAQVGELLFEPLGEQMNQIEWRPGTSGVKIVQAALGQWAGAIGALPLGPVYNKNEL